MAQEENTSKLDRLQAALLDDRDFLRGVVETFCQRLLEDEMVQHLKAESYQRTDTRRGYRNGYKGRKLKTRVGTLELLVPQDRDGTLNYIALKEIIFTQKKIANKKTYL